jgi:hypothetical protein
MLFGGTEEKKYKIIWELEIFTVTIPGLCNLFGVGIICVWYRQPNYNHAHALLLR